VRCRAWPYLGIAHEHGTGATRDGKKSLAAYRKSCDLGFTMGCTNLAGNYVTGTGTAIDLVRAAELYTDSCRHADDYACYMLGKIHARERLKPGKVLAALGKTSTATELATACDKGQALDCYLLGLQREIAKPVDAAAAASLYERACTAGNGWGCFRLGDLYWQGRGVSADFGKAAHFYGQVCTQRVGGTESFVDECNAITDRLGL
jgi:TPR repeat protein